MIRPHETSPTLVSIGAVSNEYRIGRLGLVVVHGKAGRGVCVSVCMGGVGLRAKSETHTAKGCIVINFEDQKL